MKIKEFSYIENKKIKRIKVRYCEKFLEKFVGLMFKKNSLPLVFPYEKERKICIHSFFCFPFEAIWLDRNKRVLKKQVIKGWKLNICGSGQYLLEIPLNNYKSKKI